MKKIQQIILNLTLIFLVYPCFSQDTLIQELLINNSLQFNLSGEKFTVDGWDYIQNKVRESSNVLIGEDHFSNEIPHFTKAIFDTKSFDNFFIEVDPYSTKIIVNSINDRVKNQQEFYSNYKDLFSFYALKPEFDLLEHIVKSGTNILGADQIVAYAERLIFNDLKHKTENETARQIYSHITEQSKLHLDAFLGNPKKPMYFMTKDFTSQLSKLDSLNLSSEEKVIIEDIKRSVSIYKPGGHAKRIQLIKHYLMKKYPMWKDSQNLYKYRAMHMARGESFLNIYDIGNIVANIAESNYEKSYHIMVIGETGMKGAPFRTFPPSEVNLERGIMKDLNLFFDLTKTDEDWYLFNLRPIRQAVYNGKIKIENTTLLRVIKGYDSLVIIPKLTPAKF